LTYVQAPSSTLFPYTTLFRSWLCPCGKVSRALKREGIAFDQVAVPQRRSRRPEVEALTGQKRVPVLVIDGEAICDSRRIVEYLEDRKSTRLNSSHLGISYAVF